MALRINLAVFAAGAALALLPACSADSEDSGSDDSTGGTASATGGAATGGDTSGTGATASGGATGGGATTGGAASGGAASGGAASGGAASGGSAATCSPFASFEATDEGVWLRKEAGTGAGTTTPSANFETPGPIVRDTSEGANGTATSFTYSGSGFTSGGGPGGVNFSNNLVGNACSDATSYTGISLWAYGTVAADSSGWAVAQDNVVILLGSEGKERAFRAALNTSAWGEIKVSFADAGWYDPDTVDLSALTYVKLMVAGATFDVHFDEIGWY